MKISERWLREHANPEVSSRELADRLSLAGLEAETEPMLAALPSGVVVGRIEQIDPHPQADRLRICQVNTGADALHTIVCGAANAAEGLVVPTALPGAELPNGMKIKSAKLRGVASAGMLCSAAELGLAEKSDGLMPLPADAALGKDVVELLQLDDRILELELTPNRGDCLSLRGLARECGAVFRTEVELPGAADAVVVTSTRQIDVHVDDPQACTAYHGRVVAGIDPQAVTPLWMVERLRRSGIRAIHPVVDITNYVMIELGQPMHAFDCAQLQGGIVVRPARAGEQLELLNEQLVTLNDGELVIADQQRALALAGVMGGEDSGVDAGTIDIFLESARFSPAAVAGTGRRHKLHSDSLHRFERDVDPALQAVALERATQLVMEICGGAAGPVSEVRADAAPVATIALRPERLARLLGIEVPDEEVQRLLGSLGLEVGALADGCWTVRVPSWRPDLGIEPDLIEEVARLYGYAQISAAPYQAALAPAVRPEAELPADLLRDRLAANGWQEIVSYAFVDPAMQAVLDPDASSIPLDNPLAENLAVMRTNLYSGLIGAWKHNQQRQNRRVRLFEHGVCFHRQDGEIVEQARVAGLAAGRVEPEHWDAPDRGVDFYDLKGDLERLVAAPLMAEAAEHHALHPGKTARLSLDGKLLGWLGQLHPRLVRKLDLPEAPWVFDLDWAVLSQRSIPAARPVSEFPASRRDLALVVPDSVAAAQLQSVAQAAAGPALQRALVFDVYRGKGLPDGCKSVALGLIFQDYSRTLKDQEVEDAVRATSDRLAEELGATLRG